MRIAAVVAALALSAPAIASEPSVLDLWSDRLGACEVSGQWAHRTNPAEHEQWSAVVRCEKTGPGLWIATVDSTADGDSLTLQAYETPPIPRGAVIIKPKAVP